MKLLFWLGCLGIGCIAQAMNIAEQNFVFAILHLGSSVTFVLGMMLLYKLKPSSEIVKYLSDNIPPAFLSTAGINIVINTLVSCFASQFFGIPFSIIYQVLTLGQAILIPKKCSLSFNFNFKIKEQI